jgi:hypothetical protein
MACSMVNSTLPLSLPYSKPHIKVSKQYSSHLIKVSVCA